jgi:hypothetical protein
VYISDYRVRTVDGWGVGRICVEVLVSEWMICLWYKAIQSGTAICMYVTKRNDTFQLYYLSASACLAIYVKIRVIIYC